MTEDVKNIIKESMNDINYDRIFLFGSRARDDNTENSDYDLLIVLKDVIIGRQRIKLMTKVRKKLAEKKIYADVFFKSIDEINYYKDKPGHIVRSALKEGVVL